MLFTSIAKLTPEVSRCKVNADASVWCSFYPPVMCLDT